MLQRMSLDLAHRVERKSLHVRSGLEADTRFGNFPERKPYANRRLPAFINAPGRRLATPQITFELPEVTACSACTTV